MDEEGRIRLSLWLVRGISARAIARARGLDGGLAAALRLPRAALAEAMGLRAGGTRRLLAAPADLLSWAEAQRAALGQRGGALRLLGEAGYPDLGTLEDPPEALFFRGGLPRGEGIAVVGARRARPAALRLAHRFGHRIAASGRVLISGGAYGIDAAAHRGALDAGGQTVAVLGSGVLRPLPMGNRRLFASILEAGGGLLSELPPFEDGRPEHFPRRNRLVAALARAVVVVRAAAGSGSLHTARAAFRLGRPVFVLRGGEGEENVGGEALLAEGARAIEDEEELLAWLDGPPGGAAPPPRGGGDRLLACLEGPPASVAELAEALGKPQAEVATEVARLCAAGLVRLGGPGRFVRNDVSSAAQGGRPCPKVSDGGPAGRSSAGCR